MRHSLLSAQSFASRYTRLCVWLGLLAVLLLNVGPSIGHLTAHHGSAMAGMPMAHGLPGAEPQHHHAHRSDVHPGASTYAVVHPAKAHAAHPPPHGDEQTRVAAHGHHPGTGTSPLTQQEAPWADCGYCTAFISFPALIAPPTLLAIPPRAAVPRDQGSRQVAAPTAPFATALARAPPALQPS